MARHLDIADRIVVVLNAHEFSQSFTAARRMLPVSKLEDLTTLTVSVIPAMFETTVADRSRRASLYGVDIAIQKQVDPDNLTDFDALFELIEEVNSLFAMKRLDGMEAAIWQKLETVSGAEAGYAFEHLDELRLFTAIVRLTWKVIEAS